VLGGGGWIGFDNWGWRNC